MTAGAATLLGSPPRNTQTDTSSSASPRPLKPLGVADGIGKYSHVLR